MLKVHILDYCPHCDGQAYLPAGDVVDHLGREYMRHTPCSHCGGGGTLGKWVSLEEFAKSLMQVLCKHEHTTTVGGMHFSAGDVWDDIHEECIDCGANLDRQTLIDILHADN